MKATAMGKLTRNDALSCSQLPALLSCDGYGKTPNDVLRRCIDAINGIDDDFKSNEAMAWGSLLEAQILEVAADRMGMELQHGFTEAFVAEGVPLQCSLDGMITPILATQVITTDPARGIYVLNEVGSITTTTKGILEAKLTSYAPEDSPPLHRGPLQLQGQMICTGKSWGAIATLYRGTELRIFVFDRHPGTVQAIVAAASDFARRLDVFRDTGVSEWYPLESAEDGARTYGKVEKETIDLGDDAAQWVDQLKKAAELQEQADAMKEVATTHLMDQMGKAEQARVGPYLVTWGSRSYKAQPEKITPAKDAYTIRSKTLSIKEAA